MRTPDRETLTAAELGELALALRAERPVPREEFTAALDRRAHAGFRPAQRAPSPTTDPPWHRRLWAGRRSVPLALGAVASVFIAVTAVLSSGGGSGERTPGAPLPASAPESRESAPATTGRAGAPAPLAAPDRSAAARGRKVEQAAAIVLATPRRKIETVADEAIRVTDRHGGFVMGSSVSTGEGTAPGATLELRIPASRLQAALADLSALAHVRSRSQSTADITSQFGSPRRRLANALAERRSLLKRLAAARTANEAASIRARLRLADRRIDRARTSLRRLDARVGLARVSVAIEPGQGPDSASSWTPGDALRDAGAILAMALGGLIVGLAVAVPLALAVLAALAARRSYLRHARERALDGSRPVEEPTAR